MTTRKPSRLSGLFGMSPGSAAGTPNLAPTLGSSPTAVNGASMAGSANVTTGLPAPNLIQRGGGGLPKSNFSYEGLQRRIGRRDYALSRLASSYYPSLLSSFADQANQGMSGADQSAFLSPRITAIDDAQRAAQGRLTQDLQSRGLSDSSAMATGLGQLEATGGTARSNALSGLYDQEYQRQQQAQQNLAALLGQVQGFGNAGAGILGNVRGQNLQQQQFDAQNRSDPWGMLGQLGGMAGQLFGGGGLSSLASLFRRRPGGTQQNPSIYGTGWSGYGGS